MRWLFRDDGEPRHTHVSYQELGHYVATAVRAGAASDVEPVLALATERLAGSGKRLRLELARARALVAGDDAEPLHREAVSDPEAARWPFELANAQLEYGGWLRRRHRQGEARTQLRQALDVFERLGTPVWVETARAELRAAGVATPAPEPSAWAGLTGQERQVVRLAANGLTNPEIAASLYLSPKTVSTHLYKAFPKLGVTSRAQLRDVLVDH
jgi:DNA-binding CsgD family transcriptional regulator